MSDKPFWFDEERLALQEFEMSEQSKPKQFVVYHGESGYQVTEMLGAYTDRKVRYRVIDKAAFDALSAKCAELEEQLAEKDAELKDLVRLQAGEFYLVHHKSHPDPAEEFAKAFNSLREDWVKMKAALEFYREHSNDEGEVIIPNGQGFFGEYDCGDKARETLADLKYKGE